MGACTTSKEKRNAPNADGTSKQPTQSSGKDGTVARVDGSKSNGPKFDFKIGPEIFVFVKNGSIDTEYKKYHILGEGAFGSVRLVEQKQTGLRRAMKTIKKSNVIKEEEEKMFAEVSILSKLNHPNIIRLYELF